ncbi:Leucyl/phenylalanyl-tRNA--protein transferase [Marinomonas spartinae]|uniref:Leucyl/phenylalanyl-tRNA--protein transferase n=1 Tax=Marinomonas spartinae TaxID=1792290 RepID=A0A1A8T8T1_9GAMM|nr:leucyl/phenylalanyl-tRNA--protein transferase [Marinomonas spartinae]SBS28808.1 Leucyl/phenylalanyl-tRNA--protein transferase [Marinomonas spartinae]
MPQHHPTDQTPNDPTEIAQQELVLLSDDVLDTPNPNKALDDPEGLSAVGGDLSSERLIHLYSKGFFPWYSDPDPILWWHPKERCALVPRAFHESRSLRKAANRDNWSFSLNQDFDSVIHHCAELRAQKEGTWISEDIKNAYKNLHKLGFAHSFESRINGKLVGGFYGVAMGKMFFGESMFSLYPNASKLALREFCRRSEEYQIELIDCQVESDHLLTLGATLMARSKFVHALEVLIPSPKKNDLLNNQAIFGIKTPNF